MLVALEITPRKNIIIKTNPALRSKRTEGLLGVVAGSKALDFWFDFPVIYKFLVSLRAGLSMNLVDWRIVCNF